MRRPFDTYYREAPGKGSGREVALPGRKRLPQVTLQAGRGCSRTTDRDSTESRTAHSKSRSRSSHASISSATIS